MIRDPSFANGISLVLLAVLCVRLDVLRAADVAQIVIAILALLSNRLAPSGDRPADRPGNPSKPCALAGCPVVSRALQDPAIPPRDPQDPGGN